MLVDQCFVESDMSFVFVDRVHGVTFVHRDLYGKRSLCLQCNKATGELLISSVLLAPAKGEDMISFELEANTTLVIDWNSENPETIFTVFRHESVVRPK